MKTVNLSTVLSVAYWEFIEKIRTKAFIISLLITPLFVLIFSVVPALLNNLQNDRTTQFGVWDGTNGIARNLNDSLAAQKKLADGTPRYRLIILDAKTAGQAVDSAKNRVFSGELKGIFIIPPDVEKTRITEYYGESVGNEQEISPVQSAIEQSVIAHQLSKYLIDRNIYREISRRIESRSIKLSKDGSQQKTEFLEQFFGIYGSIMIVMMMISMTGQIMTRSMLEEKSNRIIEILLSSCRPVELMLGKLLGLGGLGLAQGALWIIVAAVSSVFFPVAASFLGFLPIIIGYALLGYFFYAALLVGLGSTTATEQEAQTVTGYAIMISAVPFVFILPLLQEPGGVLALVLSYIPFLTSSIMCARIFLQTPPWWEIVFSVIWLLLWIVLVTIISAKIFRVGILAYGKKMTLKGIITAIKAG